MTRNDYMKMSKMELTIKLETLDICAKRAWEHADELNESVGRLFDKGNYEAALHAQMYWQAFDSALRMANLQGFK